MNTSDGRVVRAFHRFTLVDQRGGGHDLSKGRSRQQGAVKISCARQVRYKSTSHHFCLAFLALQAALRRHDVLRAPGARCACSWSPRFLILPRTLGASSHHQSSWYGYACANLLLAVSVLARKYSGPSSQVC